MPVETIRIIVTENGARQTAASIRYIGDSAMQANSALTFLRRSLAVLGVAWLIREYTELTTVWQTMGNRIAFVTTSMEQQVAVQQRLLDVSNKTRTAYADTAELYARLALTGRNLGLEQEQVVRMTQTLNEAFILSGATEREASAAMIQFTQALSMGVLRGFELRSVMMETRAVADLIAQEMGVQTEALKELGAQGKITSEIMVRALTKGADGVDALFAKSTVTLSQTFTVLRNQIMATLAAMNKQSGLDVGLGKAVLELAMVGIPQLGKAVTLLLVELKPVGPYVMEILRNVGRGIVAAIVGLTTLVHWLKEHQSWLDKIKNVLNLLIVPFALWISANSLAILVNMTMALLTFNKGLYATLMLSSRILAIFLLILAVIEAANQLGNWINSGGPGNWGRSLEGWLNDTMDSMLGTTRSGPDSSAWKSQIRGSVDDSDVPLKNVDILGSSAKYLMDKIGPALNSVFSSIQKELDNQTSKLSGGLPGMPGESQGEIEFKQLWRKQEEEMQLQRLTRQGDQMEHAALQAKFAITRELENLQGALTDDQKELLTLYAQRNAQERILVALHVQDREYTQTLNDQVRLAGMLETTRKVEELMLPRINAYRQAGAKLSEGELFFMEARLNMQQRELAYYETRNEILGDTSKIEQQLATLRELQGNGTITRLQAQRFEWEKTNEMLEKQTDALSGLKRSFNEYALTVTNTADQMKTVFDDAFKGMEDAFVEFVRTGKLSFSSLVDTMIADLARMAYRQAFGALIGMVGNAFFPTPMGSMTAKLGLASGGDVGSGAPYWVGERGPELFVPQSAGRVIPNGSPVSPVVNVHVVNVSDPKEVPAMLNTAEGQSVILNVIRRNKTAVKHSLS